MKHRLSNSPTSPRPISQLSTHLKSPHSSPLPFLGIMVILVLIAALLFMLLPRLKTTNLPAINPTPTPKSLKIPGMDLVAEGSVAEIGNNYLMIKDNNDTVFEAQAKIFFDPQTLVWVQTFSSLPTGSSPQSTSSGITVSTVKSQEKTTIDKINVGDKVKIMLDERDYQLWATSINILRKDKK